MKLLVDENISYKLAARLSDLFPDSAHVRTLGLWQTDDRVIWERARRDGYAILTKDQDLYELSALFGHPPKIILVCIGNCSTGQIESLVRWRAAAIRTFLEDETASCLQLQ